MPYCAKCGVEVENGVKNCPLCKFPIPDILSGEGKKEEERKYPKLEFRPIPQSRPNLYIVRRSN